MHNQEIPLIGFTVLIQLSVGLTILFNSFVYWPAFNNRSGIKSLLHFIPGLALLFAALGIGISLFHLGNIVNIQHVIVNLKSSWLSREIFCLACYFLVLIVFVGLTFGKTPWHRFLKILLDLTSIIGLVLIFCMARVYQLETMPLWNNIFTQINFFAATIFMGSSGVLIMITKKGGMSSIISLCGLSIGIALTEIVLIPIQLSIFANLSILGVKGSTILLVENPWLFYGRIVILIIHILIITRVLVVLKSSTGSDKALYWLVRMGFLTAFTAEIVWRVLFYSIDFSVSGM